MGNTKICTFRFEISNWTLNMSKEEIMASSAALEAHKRIKTSTDIDKTVNSFLSSLSLNSNVEVLNIIVTSSTVDRHNNGRPDTVWLNYTILYKEV